MSIRVCDLVKCPYSRASGCSRYGSSTSCHLAWSDTPGIPRQGMLVGTVMYSQYWLYADETCDLEEVQRLQEAFISQPEEVRRIAREESHPLTW